MKRLLFLILPFLLFLAPKTFAQKSHEQAAERVLNAMGVQKNIESNYQASLNDQLSRVLPASKPVFISVMNKLKDKYLNWNEAKKTLIPAYTAAYSEQELNDIEKFLNTSTGKKFIEKQPALNTLENEWVKKTLSAHQADLMQMMTDAMKTKKP